MRYHRAVAHLVLLMIAVALAAGAAAAYEPELDAAAIEQAIAIGQSRIEATRIRYHRPYRIPVARAPVDYIDVVTPFRRVELAAESRARAGDHRFGQRDAIAALTAASGDLEIFVELTFHPLNAYLGVPAYEVALARAGAPEPSVAPRGIERIPRHRVRVDALPLPYRVPGAASAPRGSDPLLGGTVIAAYDGRLLDPKGLYDVVVSESGRELARVRVDLGRLR